MIARRDEYGLTHPALRWEEEIFALSALSQKHGAQQRDHLSAQLTSTLRVEQLQVPGYAWSHPRANDFLLKRAYSNQQAGHESFLTANDLRDCVMRGITPLAHMSEAVWNVLVKIACDLSRSWTDSDLQTVQINTQSDEMGWLLEQGFIVHAGGPFHQIADGIFDLMQAWQKLKSQ
jgi:hypothetical protein